MVFSSRAVLFKYDDRVWPHRGQVDADIVPIANEPKRLALGSKIDTLRYIIIHKDLHTQPGS